ATASAEVQNPACGDVMRLSIRVQDGRISDVRFRAKGCVPAIACGSRLTEMLNGCTLTAARALRREDLVNSLGGLPEASVHAAILARMPYAPRWASLGSSECSNHGQFLSVSDMCCRCCRPVPCVQRRVLSGQ